MRTMLFGWASRILVGALLIVPFGLVAACGSQTASTPSPSPSPSSPGAITAIKANWQSFFAGTTPAVVKIDLLQNGKSFAATINAQANSALAKSTVAKVSAVKLTSPTTATVTYSILLGSQTALPDQHGQAIYEGSTWKVSAASFEALLKLEQGTSSSPSPSP